MRVGRFWRATLGQFSRALKREWVDEWMEQKQQEQRVM
jgi:hypothetical protein